MQESLYDRFRPFKPYDLVLGLVMIILVAASTDGTPLQVGLIVAAGLCLFVILDFVQRLVPVPTPQWQALVIIAINTAVVTFLVQLRGGEQFTLAFYMLNVGFATVAFGEQIGIATALLSVMAQIQLSMMIRAEQKPVTETGLTLAVLLTLVAILVRINRLQHHAIFDAVTGLRNHRYFQVRLRDELNRSERHGQPTSLIMLDLDNFKKVNDQFGHAFGDETLRRVGQVLEQNARALDVICRYGGEEIAIVLPETGSAAAVLVAERLRKAVEATTVARGSVLTISLGVATFPKHGRQSDELIKSADAAMYGAKKSGKNCVMLATSPNGEST